MLLPTLASSSQRLPGQLLRSQAFEEQNDSADGGAVATTDVAAPSSQPSLHDGITADGLLSAGGSGQIKGRKRAAPVDLELIEDKEERRKEQHRMRNRANAAASRARRMQYVSNLEQRLRETDEENGRLHSQLAEQEEEIRRLRKALAAVRGQGGSPGGSPRATPSTEPAGEPSEVSPPGSAGKGTQGSGGRVLSPSDGRRGAAQTAAAAVPGEATVPLGIGVPPGAAVPAGAAVEPQPAADLPAAQADAAGAAARPRRVLEGRQSGTPALVAVAPVTREAGPASAGDSVSRAGVSVALSHALGPEEALLLPQQPHQQPQQHNQQQRHQLQRRVVQGLQQQQQQWQQRQRHMQQLQRLQAEQLLHDLQPRPASHLASGQPALATALESLLASASHLAPAAAPSPASAANLSSLAPPATAAGRRAPSLGTTVSRAAAAAVALPPSPTPAAAEAAQAAWVQQPPGAAMQPAGLAEADQGPFNSVAAWLTGAQPNLQGLGVHLDVPSPADASGSGSLTHPGRAAASAAGLAPNLAGNVAAGLPRASTNRQLNPVQLAQLLQIHDSPLAAAGASAASRAVAAALGSAWPLGLAGLGPVGGLQPGQGIFPMGLPQQTEVHAEPAGHVLGTLPAMAELSTQPTTPSSRPESGGAIPAVGDRRDARASPLPSTAGTAEQGWPQRPEEGRAAASLRAGAWQQRHIAAAVAGPAYVGAAHAPGQAAVKEKFHGTGRDVAGMEAAMSLGAADGVAEALLDLASQG